MSNDQVAERVASLEKGLQVSEQDRRDIWENISALNKVAAQLDKIEALCDGKKHDLEVQGRRLDSLATKLATRLDALEKQEVALKTERKIALRIGNGVVFCLYAGLAWILAHAFEWLISPAGPWGKH